MIVDWGTGEFLPESTTQFRAMLQRRAVAYWTDCDGVGEGQR